MPKPITVSDLDMLCYFWEEKEDLERYVCWNDLQPELQAKYPEILKAWADYKASRTTLTAVLLYARDRAERATEPQTTERPAL